MIKRNNKTMNKKTKIFKCIIVMAIVICVSIPSFFNIANATVYDNLPVSTLQYNSADNSVAFPDSYKQYIKNLKASHPNWTFKALYTGLDWTQSVTQESYDVKTGISTVPGNSTYYGANWKKDGVNNYVDGTFVVASKKAVAYCLDPRNFLNDTAIFQFEALDFNGETGITSTIDKVISGTPMASCPTQYKRAGNMVNLENGFTWSQLIINAARNAGGNGISAVFLASRMKQETSLDILNNGSINGSSSTYPGIYNFFNMGATPNADGNGSVTNGLAYASSNGWTTPQSSIYAGATSLWSNYIKWGQNTVYFQKFDVCNIYGNAKFLYGSQYMTNILAPSSESVTTYNAYSKAGLLDSSFVFYVPVYNNMPTAISAHPDSETTAATVSGTDLIYLDDGIANGPDYFNVRSGPDTEYNVIRQIVETSEGAENRTKFVRTQIGTNGWDKITLSDGTEGYIYQSNVKTYNYTHVSGIALDKTSTTLDIGATTTLTANISPTNSYIKSITWSSSDPSVATVDGSGKVTAVKLGTTNITATTLDGSKTATCAITVGKTLATSISVTGSEYPVVVGNYLQVSPTIAPSNTTDASYDMTVADTSIAIVESGKIKGLKLGNTTVTLTTKDGSNKSCAFTLKVTENIATINNLTVDNTGIITKVVLGTTSLSIKDNVTTAYTKRLVNVGGTILNDTDNVGTGSRVQILSGTDLLQEYTIAISGDVNGDAKSTASDYVLIKNYIMISNTSLNNIQQKGADYNNDGKVTASDYVLIKNYIMSH